MSERIAEAELERMEDAPLDEDHGELIEECRRLRGIIAAGTFGYVRIGRELVLHDPRDEDRGSLLREGDLIREEESCA